MLNSSAEVFDTYAREQENRHIQEWTKNLALLSNLPSRKKYEMLAAGLRCMTNQKKIPNHRKEIDDIYEALHREIISDPSHAEHFEAILEAQRIPGAIGYGAYRDHMERYFMLEVVLRQIPTPEVVALLGKYLYDDRDTPDPILFTGDCSLVPANSEVAMGALSRIGLKNPPIKPGEYNLLPREDLETWKLWWEQVKAGTRTFSFEGKDNAYRFKKEGGYEILSASAAQRINRETRVDVPKEQRIEEVRRISRQTWLIILTIFTLLICLSWNKWRKNALPPCS